MSILTDFLKKKTYRKEVQIGEPIIVYGPGTPANTVGPGSTLTISSYPELYDKIGQIYNEYWIKAASNTSTAQIFATHFGNNLYLATGSGNEFATSTDAKTWLRRTVSGGSNTYYTIASSPNLFLIGGSSGALITSTDAVTWFRQSTSTNYPINHMTYGNNRYIFATDSNISVSSDGTTWTNATNFQQGWSSNIRKLVYTGSKFYFAGYNGIIGTSTNGLSWDYFPRLINPSMTCYGINYGNGLYVAVGESGVIKSSTDAITWETRTSGTTSQLFNVTYDNSRFYAFGNAGALVSSDNGTTWTQRTSGTTSYIISKTYGNGTHLIVGSGGMLRSSADGITWETRTSGTNSELRTIIFGNNCFVTGGAGGVLLTSDDNGVTWTPRTSGTTSTIHTLFYSNGLYLMGGNGGLLKKSQDAVTWTDVQSLTTSTIRSIVYLNNRYVYNGYTNFGTSTDGTTWQTNIFYWSTSYDWYNSCAVANNFVVPTNSGYILPSKGLFLGSNTTSNLHNIDYIDGSLFVTGDSGTIRRSDDHAYWTNITSNATATIYDMTYGKSQYIAVGYYTLNTSTDGNSWKQNSRFNGTTDYRTVSYGNGIYITGGTFSNVYTSTDINIFQGTSLVSDQNTQFYVPNMNNGPNANVANVNYSYPNSTRNNFRILIKAK